MAKNKSIFLICVIVLLSGCITTSPDRVMVLEQHIAEAEKKIAALEAAAENSRLHGQETFQERFAAIRVQQDEQNERISILTGKMEELTFSMDEKMAFQDGKTAKAEELINLNQERIAQLEEIVKPGTVRGKNNPPSNTQTNAQPAGDLSEEQLYNIAKEAFDRGELDPARVQFEQFLIKFPKSKFANNAQFWIAETYYRQKWYEKAILEYQKVMEKYPAGNKLPAALLKQGFSFLNMKDDTNAKIILNELVKQYPKSPEADAARTKLKSL